MAKAIIPKADDRTIQEAIVALGVLEALNICRERWKTKEGEKDNFEKNVYTYFIFTLWNSDELQFYKKLFIGFNVRICNIFVYYDARRKYK